MTFVKPLLAIRCSSIFELHSQGRIMTCTAIFFIYYDYELDKTMRELQRNPYGDSDLFYTNQKPQFVWFRVYKQFKLVLYNGQWRCTYQQKKDQSSATASINSCLLNLDACNSNSSTFFKLRYGILCCPRDQTSKKSMSNFRN